MKYSIEYRDLFTNNPGWYPLKESYPSQDEATRAVSDLMALGGPWVHRAYRVGPLQLTAPTHTELVRLVERLRNRDAVVAFWFGDDGAEAVLFDEDEIAAALPGGPVRKGLLFGRLIKEVVWELLARDHEAAHERERVAEQERERERAAALEAQQRAAQERERAAKQERERAAVLEAQQRAAQEREHAAKQERERAAALEAQQRAAQAREQIAKQERERAALEAQQRAAQERERVAKQERERAALEAQQRAAQECERAAKQERERAVALEAQQRAVLERERAAKQERERAAALEAQQRAAAQERARVAKQERERAAALERERVVKQERERAAALERERVAKQERERAAALERKGEPPVKQITRPVATPSPVAAVAPPVSVARVVQSVKGGGDREIIALANLLRCGPWPEGMRASDLLKADQLPAGAYNALQELVGTATLTVRALGNALKRVQEKRIEGSTLKVTRTIDNHGFALWQVVNALSETSTDSERPSNAELLRGALTGMGYGSAEANYAVSALRARLETDPLAALVREALGVLSRRPMPGSKTKCR